MSFRRTLGTAFSSLINNKLRSFLTTLGIIIGVAAVIVMVAVSAGAEAVIAEQINSLGANLIIVSAARGTPGAAKTLVYDDAVAIRDEIGGITGVASEQAPAAQTVKAGNLIFEAEVLGTTVDFPIVRDAPISDGRFFNDSEIDGARKVVVLGSALAKDLFGD
ncbi:MAG: ABC transporter permease, partial [Anaerolineae bacterium]|nr:ABC transporter permease [Anaerolineae bacterium]